MDKMAILPDLPFIQIPDRVNLIDIKSLYICSLSDKHEVRIIF